MITPPKQLKNTYYGIRHGKAINNVQFRLASNPNFAINSYGLCMQGLKEVRELAEKIPLELNCLPSQLEIYSSDFLRTRETAEVIKSYLGIRQLHLNPNLRERDFGELDMTHEGNAQMVYGWDRINPYHSIMGTESSGRLQERVSSVLRDIERSHSGKTVIIVSHHDTLVALQSYLCSTPFRESGKSNGFNNAEMRRLGIF